MNQQINKKKSKHLFGLIAEFIAIFAYIMMGYRILYHRKKLPTGEVDIIAYKRNVLVFIEVKARTSALEERIVSEVQKQRIINSAKLFTAQDKRFADCNIRFDLFFFRPYKFPMIIKNAW